MTMNIEQMREVIALNKGTLPVNIRKQVLAVYWQNINERPDSVEMHGTNTWLAHIPHPTLPPSERAMLPVYITGRVDGSVWVDDHYGILSGVCASSVSMANDLVAPESAR